MIKGAVAIFKRDFKKFMSNPFVMMMTMFMPIMYLIIFGNAMGGTITHIPIAVVQEEPAVQDTPLFVSTVEILRNQAQQDNPRTFDVTVFTDEQKAKRYLKNGIVKGVVVFPSTVSRDRPVRLYVDSSDYITPTLIQAGVQAALLGAGAHNPVNINKIYGDIKYIQFFGVGVIVMAIFMSTMMGGGIALIKDREMGIIEGYLVTPVKRSSIILGMIGERYHPCIPCRVHHFRCRYPCHRCHRPEPGRFPADPARHLYHQPRCDEPDGLDGVPVFQPAGICIGYRVLQPHPLHDQRGFLPDNRHARLAALDNRHQPGILCRGCTAEYHPSRAGTRCNRHGPPGVADIFNRSNHPWHNHVPPDTGVTEAAG